MEPIVIAKNLTKSYTKGIRALNNVSLTLEVHKNFNKIVKNKTSTIFAILDGAITDKNGRSVLSYGDIIRTDTLIKLSELFRIKNKLSVLKLVK